MAWIETIKNGYRAIWRDSKGDKKKGPKVPTKAEAEAWAIANGHAQAPVYKLNDLVDDFCDTRIAENGIQKTYASDLRQRLPSLFLSRGWSSADQITISEIDRWWRDTDGKGVQRPLAQLLSLLRWAFHHRDVPVGAKILTYRAPRRQRKVKPADLLSAEQIGLLMEAAAGILEQHNERPYWPGFPPHLVALIHYLSTYGARPVTACKLRIADIDFASGELTVRAKRSGEWRHPLRADTITHFAALAHGRSEQPDAHLFLNFKGEPWKLTHAGEADQLAWWYHAHLGIALELGPLARIYHLKRYAISSMRAAGADAETVAKITGHLTTEQVDTYLRTSETQLKLALKFLPPQMPPRAPTKSTKPTKQKRHPKVAQMPLE